MLNFSKLISKNIETGVDSIVSAVKMQQAAQPFSSSEVTGYALSSESISNSAESVLARKVEEVSVGIESLISKFEMSGEKYTDAQRKAGIIAGIVGGDMRAFLKGKTFMTSSPSADAVLVPMNGVDDGTFTRAYSAEAYDETDNRDASSFSVAYNLQAARQDEFGETFFPTITVSPDQVGIGVTIRLMMVMNDLTRNVSGELDQYNKINIIRALADHTILKNELTRIIPVNRAQSVSKFVDPAVVAPYAYDLEGESIKTAPLKIGERLSLLGISATDALLSAGVMDVTDSIVPSVKLKNLYVSFTDGTNTDVLMFEVAELPYSNFTYSTQNNYKLMTLNFSTTSVMINANTKTVDGSALTVSYLANLVTNNQIARLQLDATGTVNVELGDTVVYGNRIDAYVLQDSNGNSLDLTTGAGKTFADGVGTGTILGYDLDAYRSNLNRRQRGQLFNVNYFTQLYNVPMRSPITAIHPVNSDASNDASDLGALITATRIRTSNYAVTTLLNASNILGAYTDVNDQSNNWPDVMGVGRYLIKPTYYSSVLDMTAVTDSIKTSDRIADMQAALVNKIRDLAYNMFRDSEYMAASLAMSGGASVPPPTVIIGTDPVLARYLQITGDLRTLGNDFNARVVSTLDSRVKGKIFITFGVFDSAVNEQANPLHFGNMAWKPEMTLTMPISRNGQISKELTVQPSFLHFVNLPVLSVLDVTNVPNILNKVSVNFHTV